jgi:hypothetical protein
MTLTVILVYYNKSMLVSYILLMLRLYLDIDYNLDGILINIPSTIHIVKKLNPSTYSH